MIHFGRSLRSLWALDPEIIYLNHGTVGAPPRVVLAAQQRIRDEIELQPSRFLLRELAAIAVRPLESPARLRRAAAEVASFLGTQGEDLVFVDNATTGVNAVLRSLEFAAGDEILVTDHVYGAVLNAAEYVARRSGARVRTVTLPYPVAEPSVITEAIAHGIGPRTRLAIVDHITSSTAIIMPLAAIAERCRAAHVAVLVDGAHAPGVLDLDIQALGVDWYTGNLHKWAFSPRSCGVLWAAKARQAELHPLVISWGYGQGFTTEFDWIGTRDPSTWLAAPDGIAFLRELGEKEVHAYTHALAWQAAKMLAERVHADIPVPESMVGAMVTVTLPQSFGSTQDDAVRLRDALLVEDKIEVQVHAWAERIQVRVSAQVYNDVADVERLAAALAKRA